MAGRAAVRRLRSGCRIGALLLLLGMSVGAMPVAAERLQVALLPIFDAFPFYVAASKGYFRNDGLTVRGLKAGSALEESQLLMSGQIDGILTDMTVVGSFNRDRGQVRIVGTARRPMPRHPLFRVLAGPSGGVQRIADLAGVPIGVSTNTVIEYVTQRLLTAEGLSAGSVRIQSVPVIPERFQLLLQGRLRAATLPDPLAASAVAAGAQVVIDDTVHPSFSVSVLIFSQEALNTKAAAVRRFMQGWYRAAADINAAPDAYRPLLLQNIRVPGNVKDTFTIPPYPIGEVPSRDQWADIMQWMVAKGLLDKPVAYETSVTEAFLPGAGSRPEN